MPRPIPRCCALTLLVAGLAAGPASALADADAAVDAPPSAASPRVADATPFLVVSPAGRGNAALAQGFLADLGREVERGWVPPPPAPRLLGQYHVASADALAAIGKRPPLFALVSPGFFLEHRARLDMRPLLDARRAGGEPVARLVVVEGSDAARAVAAKSVARLRIGGPLAAEPAWALGPVLGPLASGGAPELRPVARALEAVRQLRAGTLDAVLLHDADWSLLGRTAKAEGLVVAFTSAPLPEGPVVTFGPASDAAKAAAASLVRLDGTPEGRKVLDRMTLDGFVAPGTDWDAVAARMRPAGAQAAP